MKNKKIQKSIIFTVILAIFTLQIGLVWAADETKSIYDYPTYSTKSTDNNAAPSAPVNNEQALQMINKAHAEVDAMKARLLQESNSESDKFMAYQLTTDFHNQINNYYAEGDKNAPTSFAQNNDAVPAQLYQPNLGGSSNGSGASGTTPNNTFSPVAGSGSGSGSSTSGITNALNGALGGSSSGSAASSSVPGNGILNTIGNLLGAGTTSNNASSSTGLGGFVNNLFTGLFSGNGFMSTVGNAVNFVMGAGSTSSLTNFVNNFKTLLQNGVGSNGTFSFKLFLFNTIWNTLTKWLLSKLTSFINSLATKIQTALTGLINKVPSNIPLIGGLVNSLKTKAQNAISNLVSNLQAKALTFANNLLNKAKTMIQNKLGI